MSQIMERLALRAGPVALLSQSGAMAISLSVRGQQHLGLDFGLVATFGNAADVKPVEALEWLAGDAGTRVVGLYLEGLDDAAAFARAAGRCHAAGQRLAVLRSGLSHRGAAAVASHTASMSGEGEAFRALCRQLGVVLCDSAESLLWTLKALAGGIPQGPPRVAFASISGGACALWADRCQQLGLALPAIDAEQAAALVDRLPPFLSPSNPLDLGPAVFDDAAFEGALDALATAPAFNLLVVYLFTSSPTLMGGLRKVQLLETLARRTQRLLWVVWEAATDEEWAALARSEAVTAFRDLGQAAQALAALRDASPGCGYRPIAGAAVGAPGAALAEPAGGAPAAGATTPFETEPAVKAWLREAGLTVPRAALCDSATAARAFAATCPEGVVVKIVSPALPHKTDVGGVVLCEPGTAAAAAAHARVLENVRAHRPGLQPLGVLVEERITAPGLELVVTVRRSAAMGLVTVIGRGGEQVEVDPDVVVHVGQLVPADLPALLAGLRCAPLLRGHRGRAPLALSALADAVVRLQQALLGQSLAEVELNPVRLTADKAWVLDALATASVPVGLPAQGA